MDENRPDAEQSLAQSEQENIVPEQPKTPAKKPTHRKRTAKAAATKRKTERSKVLNRILTVILTLLLIVLAILVFVFRDELTGESLRRAFGKETSVAPARDAFTYETGAEQVFAAAGDGLAVASSSSVQLLDAKGQTVFKQVVSFEMPAVFACDGRALFCDLGGTECISVGMDGESVGISSGSKDDREILTAGMNDSGWFALVTAEPGYKALVSVYNADCEKQFEWWSGTGYVLRAAVSPDNRSLAVLCAEAGGTKLHFFALNSEEEQVPVCFLNTLTYDLTYLSNDLLCVVGETGVWLVSPDGEIKNHYDIVESNLLDYEFGQSFLALFVSDYRGGGGGTLLTLDFKGTVLGTQTVERDVVSLSARGKQLLVMTGGGLVLYDQALVRQYANETLMTAKRAILRPAGDILLLSAYSAERFSF